MIDGSGKAREGMEFGGKKDPVLEDFERNLSVWISM